MACGATRRGCGWNLGAAGMVPHCCIMYIDRLGVSREDARMQLAGCAGFAFGALHVCGRGLWPVGSVGPIARAETVERDSDTRFSKNLCTHVR